MVLFPDYFPLFACSASNCVDSCCRAGWEIPLDADTADFYRSCGIDIDSATEIGADGDTIFRRRDDKSCVFFRGDGLCDLYIKTGGRLGEICGEYPRFYEEYDLFTETGLSFSCATAAEIMLSFDGCAYTNLKRECEDELLKFLADAREKAVKMIYLETEPDDALKKLLIYSVKLQDLIDYGEIESIGEISFDDITETILYDGSAKEFLQGIFSCDYVSGIKEYILKNTEILSGEWRRLLEKNSVSHSVTTKERMNYLGYLVYRYFLKAINTEDIATECLFIAVLYRLAESLDCNYLEAVKHISREIEHNAENSLALHYAVCGE